MRTLFHQTHTLNHAITEDDTIVFFYKYLQLLVQCDSYPYRKHDRCTLQKPSSQIHEGFTKGKHEDVEGHPMISYEK